MEDFDYCVLAELLDAGRPVSSVELAEICKVDEVNDIEASVTTFLELGLAVRVAEDVIHITQRGCDAVPTSPVHGRSLMYTRGTVLVPPLGDGTSA